MPNEMVVTEMEVQEALEGRRLLVPDAAGSLWVIWSDGKHLNLTKIPESGTLPIAAGQGLGAVPESP